MSKNPFKRLSNMPPHVALILAIIGVIALASAALLFSDSEPGVKANLVPRAARVERVEGSVGVARAFDKESASQVEWAEASVNSPVSWATASTRIRAHALARLPGRNYARLDPGTSLDVLSLADDSRHSACVARWLCDFRRRPYRRRRLFEVATPNGAVDFLRPLYQVADDSGSTMISA